MFEELAYIARVGGLIYLFLFFLGVLVYALWPRNQKTFDRAARQILDDEDRPWR